MSDIKNIFADEADTPTSDGDEFLLPTLNLDDESLDVEETSYVPIPLRTETSFEVYDAEVKPTAKGYPMWKLTLRALEDTWGPGKRVFMNIVFMDSTMKFSVKPFLKAVDHMPEGGALTKEFVTDTDALLGLKFTATVRGYQWKNPDTDAFESSTGRNKKAVPSQAKFDAWGIQPNEELGNLKPYTEPEDEELSMSGLAEFSADDYL